MKPERIHDHSKLSPLRRDVHMLGTLLGQVLIQQEGRPFFDVEERIRRLSIASRRSGGPRQWAKLRRLVERLPAPTAEKIIRAFSVFFQLVNLAEDSHRVRRKRYYESLPGFHPQRGSIEDVVHRLYAAGVSYETLAKQVAELSIVLVLTAHPTQALPPTMLTKHRAIWDLLMKRQLLNPVPKEEQAIARQLLERSWSSGRPMSCAATGPPSRMRWSRGCTSSRRCSSTPCRTLSWRSGAKWSASTAARCRSARSCGSAAGSAATKTAIPT